LASFPFLLVFIGVFHPLSLSVLAINVDAGAGGCHRVKTAIAWLDKHLQGGKGAGHSPGGIGLLLLCWFACSG